MSTCVERGEGRTFWLLRNQYTFKVTGEETGGAFCVAELAADAVLGPPPHVHLYADESFYVLDGTFEFTLAGEAFSAGPGAFVHLPRGVVHTHRAGGGAPARALVIQAPAGVERFFADAGRPTADVAPHPAGPTADDLGRIVAAALKHGIEVPTT